MDYDAGESQRIYKVVINDEEEYASWLAYIKDVWLDMRPLGPGRAIGIGTRKE